MQQIATMFGEPLTWRNIGGVAKYHIRFNKRLHVEITPHRAGKKTKWIGAVYFRGPASVTEVLVYARAASPQAVANKLSRAVEALQEGLL